MFCMHCGAKLKDYARYCPYCGTKVEELDLYFEPDEDKEEILSESASEKSSDSQNLIAAAAAIARESKNAAESKAVVGSQVAAESKAVVGSQAAAESQSAESKPAKSQSSKDTESINNNDINSNDIKNSDTKNSGTKNSDTKNSGTKNSDTKNSDAQISDAKDSSSLKRILMIGLIVIAAAGLIGLGVRAVRNIRNAQNQEEQQEETIETDESVGQYIASSSDISEERLAAMQEHASSVLSIQLKNTTSDRETVKDMTYLGNYTLVNKDYESNGGYQNIFYLVYHVTTVNSSGTEQGAYYWYIGYHDIKIKADDDDSDDYTATATPTVQTGKYYGYETLDDLYQSVVKDNRGNYIFEDNVEDIKPAAEEEESEEQTEETQEEASDEEDQEQTTPAAVTDGQYFPDSSSTLLTQEQINSLSSAERSYAVNEIYARHGYIFRDAGLQSYYEQFSWYTPTTPADSFTYDVFNYTEQQNIMNLRGAQ